MSLKRRLTENRSRQLADNSQFWLALFLQPELTNVLAFRRKVGLPLFTGESDAIFETEAYQAAAFRSALERSKVGNHPGEESRRPLGAG